MLFYFCVKNEVFYEYKSFDSPHHFFGMHVAVVNVGSSFKNPDGSYHFSGTELTELPDEVHSV